MVNQSKDVLEGWAHLSLWAVVIIISNSPEKVYSPIRIIFLACIWFMYIARNQINWDMHEPSLCLCLWPAVVAGYTYFITDSIYYGRKIFVHHWMQWMRSVFHSTDRFPLSFALCPLTGLVERWFEGHSGFFSLSSGAKFNVTTDLLTNTWMHNIRLLVYSSILTSSRNTSQDKVQLNKPLLCNIVIL